MNSLTRPRRAAGALLLAALLAAGCGGGGDASAVSGPVTYNGKPLAAGVLNLRSAAGVAATGRIDAGRYKIDGPLAPGDYQAYVTPPPPEPQAPGTRPAGATAFNLPERFRDPAKSGVTGQTQGRQQRGPRRVQGLTGSRKSPQAAAWLASRSSGTAKSPPSQSGKVGSVRPTSSAVGQISNRPSASRPTDR